MSLVQAITSAIKNNAYQVDKEDAVALCHEPLEELCNAANHLREYFCGQAVDLCTIINGKSGKCSENCKYCAQSGHYNTQVQEYPILSSSEIIKEALYNEARGILRFSIVTSGRTLTTEELDNLCDSYRKLHESCGLSLCASHGLLTLEQFCELKASGVVRYHNNLETSRRFFPHICTTHTYDDKITAIKNAQAAGLEVCSGGIIGLGETMEDRIDLALDLRALHIKSIPVNILNPIQGTPLENHPVLSPIEVLRTIAVFRFILPDSALRLAGGRGLLPDKGQAAFQAGANAAISGDMLTTSGISIKEDIAMLRKLQFEVRML